IKPILLNNELKGYVLDFIDKVDAIKNYNKISNDHRIFLENIIGTSYSINKAKEEALMASKTSSTVLITGESGTGKELFARAIHNHSKRAGNPFIAINCAAIPDNLLESELFGYEEGAFTGAKKGGSLGKFELADKGTIFLDEIGDMSLHLQAKLLRVLQEKEVDKIGAKHNVSIDVRIIAATNKDLEHMVKKGTFREDLYYRLNV
ncbi:sigma 54-interacting transcriptional regulator, partial [Paraclostridium sordellii]